RGARHAHQRARRARCRQAPSNSHVVDSSAMPAREQTLDSLAYWLRDVFHIIMMFGALIVLFPIVAALLFWLVAWPLAGFINMEAAVGVPAAHTESVHQFQHLWARAIAFVVIYGAVGWLLRAWVLQERKRSTPARRRRGTSSTARRSRIAMRPGRRHQRRRPRRRPATRGAHQGRRRRAGAPDQEHAPGAPGSTEGFGRGAPGLHAPRR